MGLFFVVLAAAGCQSATAEPRDSGDDSSHEGSQTTGTATTVDQTPDQALAQQQLEEVARQAFVVKVTFTGPAPAPAQIYTWSQDGTGNWRMDPDVSEPQPLAPGAPRTIVYNAEKHKAWFISGRTAYEATDETDLQGYPVDSVKTLATLMSPYGTALMITPGGFGTFSRETDATGQDIAWEWRSSLRDQLPAQPPQADGLTTPSDAPDFATWTRIEFQEGSGLISRDESGLGTDVVTRTYEYSRLADVPASLFVLPASIKYVRSYKDLIERLRPAPGQPTYIPGPDSAYMGSPYIPYLPPFPVLPVSPQHR